MCYRHIGDLKRASEDFKKVVKLDPTNKEGMVYMLIRYYILLTIILSFCK